MDAVKYNPDVSMDAVKYNQVVSMNAVNYNQVVGIGDRKQECFTSHQQLRSYGDGATALTLIRQTGEAGNRTCNPWFTRQVAYPLHHSGSYYSCM